VQDCRQQRQQHGRLGRLGSQQQDIICKNVLTLNPVCAFAVQFIEEPVPPRTRSSRGGGNSSAPEAPPRDNPRAEVGLGCSHLSPVISPATRPYRNCYVGRVTVAFRSMHIKQVTL
jgi:hypothetical protein